MIGYFGQHELVERHGGKLVVSQARLNNTHAWFERYGAATIFISRLLPLIRSVFPFAAGVARMPYWRFAGLATLGSVIWIGGLEVLGRAVGSNWPAWRHHLEYVDYAAAAVLAAVIIYVVVRRSRPDRRGPGNRAADAVSD